MFLCCSVVILQRIVVLFFWSVTAAHLTTSLDNSTLIAPMPLSDPSVKPVLLSFPHLAQYARPNAPMHGCRCIRQPSDTPMVWRRFNRCSWICVLSSNSSQLNLWISTILWHLCDWLDLSSWWWIGHGVSTIDWTLRLDDELDVLNHIDGT